MGLSKPFEHWRETNMPLDKKLITRQIEDAIDSHSLEYVLVIIEEICNEKAEHVESNWQDSRLAKVWGRAANVVDLAALKVKKLGV
jgi:hypothetical protein